jgi:hypothetical protein
MLEEHEPAAAEVAALTGQLGRQPGVVAAQSPSHLKIADLVSPIDGCSLRSPDFDVEVVKIAMLASDPLLVYALLRRVAPELS